MKKIFLFFILLLFAMAYHKAHAAAHDVYPFHSQQQQKQFNRLTGELRCLVCQNESLADSDAALAGDLRNIIYDKVNAGESDQSIISFLTQRYGDFVRYKPAVNSKTYLLWFAPFVLVLLGFRILLFVVRRRQQLV